MNPNCFFNPWCIHSVTAKIVKYDFLFMMLIIYPFHSLTYILGNIIPTHKYGYMLNYNERNNFSISICWKPIWHYNHLSNPNDSHYKKKIFQIFVLLQIPTFSLHIHLPHGKIKFLNITFFYHSIFHIGPVFLGGSMRWNSELCNCWEKKNKVPFWSYQIHVQQTKGKLHVLKFQ